MTPTTSDVRVARTEPLASPHALMAECPITPEIEALVTTARQTIEAILDGSDPRLLLVAGPCSIHDEKAALEYAGRLKALADRISDRVFVVMRVYFEKPRTTVGWKGLINDPNLDGTLDVGSGMRRARKLLVQIGEIGLPAGAPLPPSHVADIAASFQRVVVETLLDRLFEAARAYGTRSVGLAGGVSANSRLRADAAGRGAAHDVPVFVPSLALSTDNAAMIAAAGLRRQRAGLVGALDLNADAALAL